MDDDANATEGQAGRQARRTVDKTADRQIDDDDVDETTFC